MRNKRLPKYAIKLFDIFLDIGLSDINLNIVVCAAYPKSLRNKHQRVNERIFICLGITAKCKTC